jgi:hypothetical protein
LETSWQRGQGWAENDGMSQPRPVYPQQTYMMTRRVVGRMSMLDDKPITVSRPAWFFADKKFNGRFP